MKKTHISFLWNRSNLLLLLLLIFAILCYAYIFDKKLSLSGDNVTYYLLGSSIVTGNGYSEIWTTPTKPHTQYPPGYPSIISLVLCFLPRDALNNNVLFVKIVNGFFFLGTIVLLFLLLQAFNVDKKIFPVILLPMVTNPHLLRFAHIMMSEIPFLFFSMAALYAVVRIDLSNQPYREKSFFAAIVLIAVSIYIRTHGLALLVGVISYFLFKRKYSYVLWTSIVLIILVLPWIVRVQIHGGSPYFQKLLMVDPYNPDAGSVGVAQLIDRFKINFKRYVSIEIPVACFPLIEKKIASLPALGGMLGIILVSLSIYAIYRIKDYWTLIAGYLVGTFGILLFWPSTWFGVRFMISILPLVWFLSIYGLISTISVFLEKNGVRYKKLPLWFSIIFLVNMPLLYRMHGDAKKPYPPNWQNYFRIAQWVKDNTPQNTVTSCRKSGFFYLVSQRPTCVYLFSEDNIKLVSDMVHQGVDFVVVDQLGFGTTLRYLIPAINQNPNFFQKVLHIRNPSTYLFKARAAYSEEDKGKFAGASLLVMALRRFKMKNYVEAERLLSLAMNTTQEKAGKYNKVYANALNNLGVISVMRKEYSRARKLFERSMAIEQVLLGEEHPEIAMSLINIAEMYKGEKQYEIADSLFHKALSIQEKTYGPDHQYIVQTLYILLKFYSTCEKQKQADAAYKRIISIVDRAEKGKRSEFLPTLSYLEKFYKSKGRNDEVEDLEKRIKAIRGDE